MLGLYACWSDLSASLREWISHAPRIWCYEFYSVRDTGRLITRGRRLVSLDRSRRAGGHRSVSSTVSNASTRYDDPTRGAENTLSVYPAEQSPKVEMTRLLIWIILSYSSISRRHRDTPSNSNHKKRGTAA